METNNNKVFRYALEKLMNRLVFGKKKDGNTFVSRLVAIDGDLLAFETRDGEIVMNDLHELVAVREYKPDHHRGF